MAGKTHQESLRLCVRVMEVRPRPRLGTAVRCGACAESLATAGKEEASATKGRIGLHLDPASPLCLLGLDQPLLLGLLRAPPAVFSLRLHLLHASHAVRLAARLATGGQRLQRQRKLRIR